MSGAPFFSLFYSAISTPGRKLQLCLVRASKQNLVENRRRVQIAWQLTMSVGSSPELTVGTCFGKEAIHRIENLPAVSFHKQRMGAVSDFDPAPIRRRRKLAEHGVRHVDRAIAVEIGMNDQHRRGDLARVVERFALRAVRPDIRAAWNRLCSGSTRAEYLTAHLRTADGVLAEHLDVLEHEASRASRKRIAEVRREITRMMVHCLEG